MIANTADKNSDSLIAFAVSDKQETGSSPQPNSSPALQPSPNASGSSAGAPSMGAMGDLPEGEGKATVIGVCIKCHGANNFTTLRMSRGAWESEVADMKDKGAVGTDDDFRRIVDYLAKNFPPR